MTPSPQKAAVEVPLDEIKPGMVLSKPVKDPDAGDELLPDKTKLSQENIEGLKNRDIFRVYVSEESYEDNQGSSEEIVGVDFSEEELEKLAEDVLEDYQKDEQEREEQRREFYKETLATSSTTRST